MINFNEKAKEIFEQNKSVGWWDDMDRCIFQTLQLINTEIAEATEGSRKDIMDDHLPHRKMEEVELADVLIRTLDLAGRCGWSCRAFSGEKIKKASINQKEMGFSDGRIHLGLTMMVCQIADLIDEDDLYNTDPYFLNGAYVSLVVSVLVYCENKGYDVISAMNEKLEYNKHRADHKRENRAKQGGKDY